MHEPIQRIGTAQALARGWSVPTAHGDAIIEVESSVPEVNFVLALLEGCKHSLEISVPVEEVESETGKVVSSFQAKAKLPGFRPGKAPASLIRKQFQGDIRQQVLENLIPRYLQKRVEEEELRLVGRPDITKVKFDPGEPLEFTAEFEVSPEFELKNYTGIEV